MMIPDFFIVDLTDIRRYSGDLNPSLAQLFTSQDENVDVETGDDASRERTFPISPYVTNYPFTLM